MQGVFKIVGQLSKTKIIKLTFFKDTLIVFLTKYVHCMFAHKSYIHSANMLLSIMLPKIKQIFFDIADSDFVCFGWKFCCNLLLKIFVSSANLETY